MAIRNMLHLNKVNEFKEWLEKDGWCSVDTKGSYEILRMIKPKEKPMIIFSGGSKEHASFEDDLFKIVAKFLRENRNGGK